MYITLANRTLSFTGVVLLFRFLLKDGEILATKFHHFKCH